jgi:hypothetical protein
MQHKWKVAGIALMALPIRFALAESRPLAPRDEVVRSFEDAATSDRWVLERDSAHPGGPGRLIKVTGGPSRAERSVNLSPVIRAGEKVTVAERTSTVAVRLEGVALSSAGSGELLKVRLKVGGWLVRAIAEAPGRARLAGEAK